MQRFKAIPKRANDIHVRIEADSKEGLFAAALKKMGNILEDHRCDDVDKFPISRYIEVNAPDLTILLVDFLSEVLLSSHLLGAIFCEAKIVNLDPSSIRAFVYGRKVDSFNRVIRGVAYEGADVLLNEFNKWQTKLTFHLEKEQ